MRLLKWPSRSPSLRLVRVVALPAPRKELFQSTDHTAARTRSIKGTGTGWPPATQSIRARASPSTAEHALNMHYSEVGLQL